MRARKGLILFFLCFGGMIAPLPAADEITSVTILTFSGKLEISRRPNVWDPGHTNQVLQVGDRLRTGRDSRATIRLSEGTTIKVGAEANILVPEQKKGVTVNPLSGLFYIFHRDKPGQVELRNQTAVAAVRGTEFHVEAREDGVWILSVIDGEVDIESGGRQVILKTGQAAEVGPGIPPRQVPMREATDLIQWCFYYPAVLDPKELEFSVEQQAALVNSLEAYRSGDLNAALEKYPADRQSASDSERLYRAALALAAGEVTFAEQLLVSTDSTNGGRRDQRAFRSSFTGGRSALSPLDHARSATLQARSSRAAISHWPQKRRASVCGSAARVALRLRSARRSSPAYAPLSPLADRRPKQELSGIAVAWRTPAAGLNWRAFHGAIRTEYTAMSWFRFQACSTATASEKEQARIRGHLFTALLAAVRAGQHRFDFDSVAPLTSTVCAFFVRHLGHLILSADFAPRVRSHSTTESALLRRAASRAVRFSHPGSQFNSASRARRYSAARSCPP